MGGEATALPEALRQLLSTESEDAAMRMPEYFENKVVAQGNLYGSATAVTSVLCAALLESLPHPARRWTLVLLFLLVDGESSREESARGLEDLGSRCRSIAREALWSLYTELRSDNSRSLALDVIQRIEKNKAKLNQYIVALKMVLSDDINDPLDDND